MCPYKDNQNLQTLPCSWHAHPHDENVRICDVCQRHYRIDEVVNPFQGVFSFVILGFIALIFANVLFSSQAFSDTQETPHFNPVNNSQSLEK